MPHNIVRKLSISSVSLTHQCFSISVWYVVTLNGKARVGDQFIKHNLAVISLNSQHSVCTHLRTLVVSVRILLFCGMDYLDAVNGYPDVVGDVGCGKCQVQCLGFSA